MDSFYVEKYAKGAPSSIVSFRRVYLYPQKWAYLKPPFLFFEVTLLVALILNFLSFSVVLYCSSSFITSGGFNEEDSKQQQQGDDATDVVEKITQMMEVGSISRVDFGFCGIAALHYVWNLFFFLGSVGELSRKKKRASEAAKGGGQRHERKTRQPRNRVDCAPASYPPSSLLFPRHFASSSPSFQAFSSLALLD